MLNVTYIDGKYNGVGNLMSDCFSSWKHNIFVTGGGQTSIDDIGNYHEL